MRIGVDVMVFCEQVADRIDGSNNAKNHSNYSFSIWYSTFSNKGNIFRYIMSHLGSTSWSSIFVFYHSIVQLLRHSDNHVIKIWIEVSSLRHIQSERRIVVIPCKQIIWVVD